MSPLNVVVSHHHTVSKGEEAVLLAFLGEREPLGRVWGTDVGLGVEEEAYGIQVVVLWSF